MSQADDSEGLLSLDNAEWHLANEQRIAAIELQREKVQDLEQRRQSANQHRAELELQREKDDHWLDDAAQRQAEKLAAVELRRDKELTLQREKNEQRDLKEKTRAGDRQRQLGENAARRAEHTQGTWRLRDEARATKLRGENVLQDEADMRATGRSKQYPAALRDLNTVEERFIARVYVIGAFLKLTSGAQKGISYKGAQGHYIAIKQDPSNILSILPIKRLQDYTTITVSWEQETPPSEENLACFCSVNKNKVLQALLWLCANNPVYKSVTIDYEVLESWPQDHILQDIRDAFLALQTDLAFTSKDEQEGYATSLQDGLFENELDAELEVPEPGTIVSKLFFSDFHGQDPQDTSALLASLQAVLESRDSEAAHSMSERDSASSSLEPPLDLVNLHISYKSVPGLLVLDSFTDPVYFTGASPTLFLYGVRGHLVKEIVDLTFSQRFAASEPPSLATFNMPDNMTPEAFKNALNIDFNNVTVKVQMHVHSYTCTKYQRKDMKAHLETQQKENEQYKLIDIQPTPPVQQPKS
ncbi:Nucleoside-triphosphate phosphatase, partial [Scytalidium lignicola]